MKNLSVLFVLVLFEFSFPQNVTLRDTTNRYDYIIITVPEFVQACQTFKQHKESYNGFNVLIVDTSQIYAEFNSNPLPQYNIREFISYAGTYWQEPKLKYVFIVGNVRSVPNFYVQPPLPGYNAYHQSDYYYKVNLYDPDTLCLDFNVGRIPAFNENELQNYFNKVIWYETSNQLYAWMNTNLFLSESDNIFDFMSRSQLLASKLPHNFYKKFIEDADTSEYFGNLDSLMNFINNHGTSILWFSGRSYDSTFMFDPPFLVLSDLELLNNYQKYFISIYYYQSAIFDSNTNLSRELLFRESSGSLGAIVLNGVTFWPTISYIQQSWASRFYRSEYNSITEVIEDPLIVSTSYYQWKVINYWGDPSLKLKYDPVVNITEQNQEIPDGYVLYSNYPNPYNNSTKISYEIPVQSNVSIILYDILGGEVATLVNEEKPSGKHQFSFVENNLVSGVYFYTLRAGNYTQTKKMILLK